MVKRAGAGRPRKWAGGMITTSIYTPDWFITLSNELGYGSPGEALYGMFKERVFRDNGGNGNGSFEKYRHLFDQIEDTRKAAESPHTDTETAISDETKLAVLNDYLRGLLPQQVRSLRLAAETMNYDKLSRYQQAIEERTGIWIEPKIFYQRFPVTAEVETK